VTSCLVNDQPRELGGPPSRTLLGALRSDPGLLGAKPGCGEGECGACTVLMDGAAVLACQLHLHEVAGRSITTIEGLARGGQLHPVQQALLDEGACQCGYCLPGVALRAVALLATDPDPDDRRIAAAMDQSICRCGCYPRITRAIHRAASSPCHPAPPGTAVPPADALPRPDRPWDLSAPAGRDWFGVLGDGLVVVWPPQPAPPGVWATGGGAWVHVAGGSGAVTAFSGKVDVGQDNTTAFRLLVAEELAVAPDRVLVVTGDTDVCPFDMGTFGSRSMPDAGEALRRAAAGARQVLLGMAGERSDGSFEGVTGRERAARRGPRDADVAYGQLVAGARLISVLTDEPLLVAPSAWRFAGRAGHRPDSRDAVTGARRFVSDLERPGMLHAAVLRPPAPGSELCTADVTPAEAVPGATIVRGDGMVAAVADNPMTARRAVAAMVATWTPLAPGPDDVVDHLRSHPVAGEGWERAVDETVGDVDAALAAGTFRVDATYTTAYLAHVPLETSAAVAEWADNRVTVWTGTQVPFGVRARLAGALGIDEQDVRVIVPPTGGGFGGKHGGEVAIEAASIARRTGRPVKVHWSRAEEFVWGTVRPMAVIDVRSALDADGSLIAWDMIDVNAGSAGLAFPYAAPNRRLRYQPAASPLRQGSYRALAATANTFAREAHIDELATLLGADPVTYRLAHLEDDRLAAVVRAAADRFGWPGGPVDASGGVGFAAGLEKGARVATCAEVHLDHDGLRVTRLVTAYECGAVVNPDTVANQIEGGTVMALGGALFERVVLDHGRVADPSLAGYRVPRFGDVPAIDVVLVDRPDLPSAGAGETPLIAVAPAVANAVYAASGQRLRSLPLLPGLDLAALRPHAG